MANHTATSKLIEVLGRIDTTLEGLDRRLQALERSWQPPGGTDGPQPGAVSDHVKTFYRGPRLILRYEAHQEELGQLQEITIEKGDLLALLEQIVSPCLNRYQDRQPTLVRKTISYPFTEILSYRGVLDFVLDKSEQSDNQLGTLFFDQPFTSQLSDDIRGLLDCFKESRVPCAERRDANATRGVVLFDDLPALFAPGALLLGTDEALSGQVVEVSSCEIVAVSAGSEACVVEVWHFRWDGLAFSRTSSRFQLDRYGGTRRIKELPYRPVIDLGVEESARVLDSLLLRNKTNLEAFGSFLTTVQVGDYPLCCWDAREQMVGSAILDPEAFSLKSSGEGSNTPSTFGCYCSSCTNTITLDGILENPRYLLLGPTRVEGFNLDFRQWATFPIFGLRGFNEGPDRDPLRTICLDEQVRQSLAEDFERYFAKRRKSLDMGSGAGLGNGVVRHFQGPPGVGKALVAFSLAADFQRPILLLCSADLGREFATCKENLALYSELSLRWGAILVLAEAEDILEARQRDDMTRNTVIGVLEDILPGFAGAMIFLSNRLVNLDPALIQYVPQISFPIPTPEAIGKIFSLYLDQLDPACVESRDEMVSWVVVAAANLGLSRRDVQAIYQSAVEQTIGKGRRLGLKDLIRGYTTKTGRPDEWDLVTDMSLYSDESSPEASLTPEVEQLLLDHFGLACEIPHDGRLDLAFSKSFHSKMSRDFSFKLIAPLANITEELRRYHGQLMVVDWGWPNGLWSPTQGRVYSPQTLSSWESSGPSGTPQQRWDEGRSTLGPRDLVNNPEHAAKECSKPWRRLVYLRRCSFTVLLFLYSNHICQEHETEADIAIFSQLFSVISTGLQEDCGDPIEWTLVCLTPDRHTRPSDKFYTTCQAPTLRAQSAYLVAHSLSRVVDRWDMLQYYIDYLVDSSDVLQKRDHLQDILFDDDAFSTSKRYFWAINFIHEVVSLIDNSIEQWTYFRRWCVIPWKKDARTGREAYWYEQSQKVLTTADQAGEQACEDLKVLKKAFQERLERITVLRDGLGENVKLLTFVSIFFLPLGLCVAIWSINESYSRPSLLIVTAVVAVTTYAITLNLNNLGRALGKLVSPRRRALIEQMEQDADPGWQGLGRQFKAFQRSEGGQKKPSEWVVGLFLVRGVGRVGWAVVEKVVRGVDDRFRRSRDDGGSLPDSASVSGGSL
ncbi:hypothetical protein C8A01DRAFT_15915 [Parachaetomium inaequale]|uniref:ATPase AAA-type core domain-containing protein n=1 Tax=Parachaetomium inaequale TaxID=2588326 RepID=A0AAN6PGE1_9PEZI|nr:hypothetical protein C8A01DRAFT_15915 [Parachaetomium inaequale]